MRDFLSQTWRLLLSEKDRATLVAIIVALISVAWGFYAYFYPSQPAATNSKQPPMNIEDSRLEKSPIITGDHNKVEIGK